MLHITSFYYTTEQVWVSWISINFCRSYAPFWTKNTWNTQFSAFFSYMLWHIELKFCIWLCFTVLQIMFECRQFASILVGVMPLLNLEYWKYTVFHNFLLHALTFWAEILHMTLFYCTTDQVRVSSICVYIFVVVIPLLELRILSIHSIPHFSPTCFNILSLNFSYDFVYCTTDQGQVSSLCIRLALRQAIHFLHFPPTCIDKFIWNSTFDVGFF